MSANSAPDRIHRNQTDKVSAFDGFIFLFKTIDNKHANIYDSF